MEPLLKTERHLLGILEELIQREPIFHRPEFGTTRADFEAMTSSDFWEVGASGRLYGRAYVLNMLEKRHAAPHEDVWEATDFYCRKLAERVYLLTYTLAQDRTRISRRSTLWERADTGWIILYHQGTLVEEG